jgi:hypothetical protein
VHSIRSAIAVKVQPRNEATTGLCRGRCCGNEGGGTIEDLLDVAPELRL